MLLYNILLMEARCGVSMGKVAPLVGDLVALRFSKE